MLRSLQKNFLLLQTTDYCLKSVSYIGLIYGLIRLERYNGTFVHPLPKEEVIRCHQSEIVFLKLVPHFSQQQITSYEKRAILKAMMMLFKN